MTTQTSLILGSCLRRSTAAEARRSSVALCDTTRSTLDVRRLRPTCETRPALASSHAWPVRADHCFQRILLDNTVGGRWYDYVAMRPAYHRVVENTLRTAIELGNAVIDGTADLQFLDHRSLTWHRGS